MPHKGTYTILALTRTSTGVIGAPGEIAVAASSPIPGVGQRPPDIATDTAASVHGNTALLTTRTPPDDMHAVSFNQVLGKRPVALLFSTPQLCISKVCGPVTDIAAQLEHQFGKRITFIHQEVYVNNQPSKGLRPQLKAFHLQTEPWLFTSIATGSIAARLEGSFGVNAVPPSACRRPCNEVLAPAAVARVGCSRGSRRPLSPAVAATRAERSAFPR